MKFSRGDSEICGYPQVTLASRQARLTVVTDLRQDFFSHKLRKVRNWNLKTARPPWPEANAALNFDACLALPP
ncbi:MAG: hypothetical protein MI861_23955 [Pirellulales bacterium]|nr:hypothetical protein [Pirellulales bacterium]